MAVVFIEGWDHISAGQTAAKGWTAAGGASDSMVTGRWSGQAIQITAHATYAPYNPRHNTVNLTGTYLNVGWGFATKPSTGAGGEAAFALRTSALANIVYGTYVAIGSSYFLRILNSAGTTLVTSSVPVVVGGWNHYELKVSINSSTGSVYLRTNGIDDGSATSLNLGSTGASNLYIASPDATGSYSQWDDMYVNDLDTSPNTSWLGDCRVQTVFPSADGTTVQWTPLSSTNESNIDDTTSYDSDTTYNSTASGGYIDTFTAEDLPSNATAVYGVRVNITARKDDGDTRTIAPVIRQSSTDYAGTTSAGLTSSYLTYSQTYAQDPTGGDWSVSDVNGDEFGYKLVT